MDQRQALHNELQAIIAACKPFVKRLRERSTHNNPAPLTGKRQPI